jgi:hypothetical protein
MEQRIMMKIPRNNKVTLKYPIMTTKNKEDLSISLISIKIGKNGEYGVYDNSSENVKLFYNNEEWVLVFEKDDFKEIPLGQNSIFLHVVNTNGKSIASNEQIFFAYDEENPEQVEEEIDNVTPLDLLNVNAYTAKKIRDERYEICKSCPELFKPTRTCKKCGCFMAMKTWLKDATCPINKW